MEDLPFFKDYGLFVHFREGSGFPWQTQKQYE